MCQFKEIWEKIDFFKVFLKKWLFGVYRQRFSFRWKKEWQARFSINWILLALGMIHLSYKVISGLTRRRFWTMQVNRSGPTWAVLSLKSRENSVSISVKTLSNTNLVASRVRIGKMSKFLMTSLERLLCDKFCGQRRWCCYATFSLEKHNEGYSCICLNVNTQNVKIARTDRPHFLVSRRCETFENLLHIDIAPEWSTVQHRKNVFVLQNLIQQTVDSVNAYSCWIGCPFYKISKSRESEYIFLLQ